MNNKTDKSSWTGRKTPAIPSAKIQSSFYKIVTNKSLQFEDEVKAVSLKL